MPEGRGIPRPGYWFNMYMQRRFFFSSLVLSLALIGGLISGAAGPVSAATPIQPGTRIVSSEGSCTMNFIYREVVDEFEESTTSTTDYRRTTATTDLSGDSKTTEKPSLYAGTAGHCVSGVGARVAACEPSWASGDCDSSFGTVAFHVHNDSDDFAFIEIDRDKEHLVNPTMLGFDGPRGFISGSEARRGDGAHVYGNGLGVGETGLTRPRTGWLTRSDSRYFAATLPVINGDSGGPVLHKSGAALGIIAHLVVSLDFTTLDGNTVEHALRTAAASGLNLEVVPG